MLNVALRSEYFQYANPPYRAQMPAAKTVMTTAFRCTPKANSRRVPSNRHRKAAAPPTTLNAKSTQLSIMASAEVPERNRHFILLRWCPGQGLNLHDGITRRGILSPLCLPVSPPGPGWRDCVRKKPEAGALWCGWRRGSESNRRPRLCRPLHDHSATPPYAGNQEQGRTSKTGCSFEDSGAGEESRTPDLNLGKVTLYQLSYSRGQGGILRAAPSAVKPAAVSFGTRRQGEFQIVEHRHQRQYRGDIDEPGADALRTEHADALVIEQKRHGDHLGDRFYLSEEVHRDAFRLADFRHPFAHCRDGDLPPDDDHGDDRVDALKPDQDDQRSGDHQLVRDRVEERAERRRLVQAPREVAIEPVGDRGRDEQRGRNQVLVPAREPHLGDIEHPDHQRDRQDAEPREKDRDVKRHGAPGRFFQRACG